MHTEELDHLYKEAANGNSVWENRLFAYLRVRFDTFVKYRVGRREDIEDIVQNALIVVKQKYRQVDVTSSFAAWAYGVLKNEILRYYRDTKRRDKIHSEIDLSHLFLVESQLDPVVKKKLLDCLTEVSKINPLYPRILNFSYQGFGAKEICGRLKIGSSNLYVTLHRARKALKKCFER